MPLVSGRRLHCFTSVFVSVFFTKCSGGFGAPRGTSYLLLSFQVSREEALVHLLSWSHFLNNKSVFGGLYIVWVMWA